MRTFKISNSFFFFFFSNPSFWGYSKIEGEKTQNCLGIHQQTHTDWRQLWFIWVQFMFINELHHQSLFFLPRKYRSWLCKHWETMFGLWKARNAKFRWASSIITWSICQDSLSQTLYYFGVWLWFLKHHERERERERERNNEEKICNVHKINFVFL